MNEKELRVHDPKNEDCFLGIEENGKILGCSCPPTIQHEEGCPMIGFENRVNGTVPLCTCSRHVTVKVTGGINAHAYIGSPTGEKHEHRVSFDRYGNPYPLCGCDASIFVEVGEFYAGKRPNITQEKQDWEESLLKTEVSGIYWVDGNEYQVDEDKLKDFIRNEKELSKEEGRKMKGSSWREGYEQGLREAESNCAHSTAYKLGKEEASLAVLAQVEEWIPRNKRMMEGWYVVILEDLEALVRSLKTNSK